MWWARFDWRKVNFVLPVADNCPTATVIAAGRQNVQPFFKNVATFVLLQVKRLSSMFSFKFLIYVYLCVFKERFQN